MTGWVECETSD